ncbi:hypothetical protein L7F22_054927 [Adiantum nelumboides]|nr:hypothetical protein [Adiantum nelumboides]
MRSPFRKLRNFALSKQGSKDVHDAPAAIHEGPLPIVVKCMQDATDMRLKYEGLLTNGLIISGAAYDFSRSLQDMASYMVESFEEVVDQEIGNIFSLLAKVQFEMSKLLDLFDRSILDNVVTFYDAVEWTRQMGQPTAIMLLDFEEAYDRVDRGFLEGTLHRMGFPNAWIRGISALYRSSSAAVTIETMALYLRGRTPQIRGLHMPGDASLDLVEQEYVDDTMIFCRQI